MDFRIFGRKIDVHSDNVAVISEKETLTYGQLFEQVQITAEVLNSIGIRKNNRTAILSENNIDFIILVFALWKIQAIPVPMNVRLLDEEIERLTEHSESNFILIHSELKDRLKNTNLGRKIFPLKVPANSPLSREKIDRDLEEQSYLDIEDTALILYTSGTTGSPKGVILSYNNLLSSADSADYLIKHTTDDRWLSSLPFYHIGGISIPVRAFLSGSKLVIPNSLKAADLANALQKFNPTLASFVTTMLEQLIKSSAKPNKKLRLILLGGGPIEDNLVVRALKDGWRLAKVYGSTETSSLVSSLMLNEDLQNISSAGKPLPPNKIYILDENGSELPAGCIGEIVVKGSSIMKGYWRNQAETNLKLRNNKYFSGDLGYLDKNGFLFIESRRTDLIISGGENVNPLEVENEILKFPNVKEVCVFPLKDKVWGQIVAALIVPLKGSIDEEKLKISLRSKISHFKVPKRIFFADKLPRTSLGKIKREEVRLTYEEKGI